MERTVHLFAFICFAESINRIALLHKRNFFTSHRCLSINSLVIAKSNRQTHTILLSFNINLTPENRIGALTLRPYNNPQQYIHSTSTRISVAGTPFLLERRPTAFSQIHYFYQPYGIPASSSRTRLTIVNKQSCSREFECDPALVAAWVEAAATFTSTPRHRYHLLLRGSPFASHRFRQSKTSRPTRSTGKAFVVVVVVTDDWPWTALLGC